MHLLAILGLTLAVGGMLSLPLAPALLEIVHRRDASALVTRQDDGAIRNFAYSFRKRLESLLPALQQCAAAGCNESALLAGEERVLLVGGQGVYGDAGQPMSAVVLFAKQAHLADSTIFLKEIYASTDLRGGGRGVLRAVMGEGDITLDEETVILRWIHAEGELMVGACSSLYGRASACKAIYLARACRFERMHAPVIVSTAGEIRQARPSWTMIPDPQKRRAFGRSRIHGDLHLASEEICWSDIIASGDVYLDERTRVFGSIKANGNIRLRRQSEVGGSLVSGGAIHIDGDCFVKGPVLAEREIRIGSGTQIGTPQAATSISSPRIRIGPDCVLHGTVWARIEGWVEV